MDENHDRGDQLDEALAEYLNRIDAGEHVDWDRLLAERPQIAREIQSYLKDAQALNKAALAAETVVGSHAGNGSAGLQIRCPHCSNQVELLADTPFEEITCHSCGSVFNLVDRDSSSRGASPLRSIGRFELVSRLGIGGFGSVWKARDAELDRIVAVKIPRKDQLAPQEIEQFFREARAAAQLRHPNIVPVHEVGRDGDVIFIVCDLVRGVELSDWLAIRCPSPRDTAELCRKMALALHHAHEAGVIHRDLKPSNVMIDADGEPHVMDFGLAKRELGEVTMTVDGQILGTPAYMSPEQAAGRSHWTDRRTDVYSLGVILFWMLTGDLPFRGNIQMQVFQRLSEDPPDPRKLNPYIPRDLATICLKCMERDPNRRYATARALADEFDRFLKGMPIEARPISRLARLGRWARRKPALASAAGLVLFLAVAGPLAAVRIEGQRRRLAELVDEKNRLIDRHADDKQRDVRQIAQLQQEVDLWEGRINPWKLWPARAETPPRRQLLQELDRRRYDAMNEQLRGQGLNDWEAACGHLALAMLARENARKTDFGSHLDAAEPLLLRLTEQNPQERAYRAALAACYEGLAEWHAEDDEDTANRYLEEASGVYERLKSPGGEANQYRVDQLEAKLRGAVAAGFEGAKRRLDEATQLTQEIAEDWPTEPVEFYQFVRRLSGKEPLPEPATLGSSQ